MKVPAPVSRSPSMAYPQSRTLSILSRMQYCARQQARAIIASVAFILFVLLITSDYAYKPVGVGTRTFLRGSPSHFGGAYNAGYFSIENSVSNNGKSFSFAAVSDLDQLSRIAESSKPKFHSVMVTGKITYDGSKNKYSIDFDEDTRNLVTSHNEAGRGAEFSELTIFQDRLLTFDDRSGDVFEILNKKPDKDGHIESYVVPRFVITEGEGDTDKGMKWEWATVKHDTQELYMGSMGKEYTNPDGSIANRNNLWIGVLDSNGQIRRENWTEQYQVVRAALGASSPGYLIHEAVLWSDYLKKWCFLPRRVSSDQYDENLDEKKGSNKLVLVDEKFTQPTVIDIKMKKLDPLHGFSTFAFVPNTQDRHALAIRSVEEDCVGGDDDVCKQRSYFLVFDVLTGDVLLDETRYRAKDIKLEGVEFVDINTSPRL